MIHSMIRTDNIIPSGFDNAAHVIRENKKEEVTTSSFSFSSLFEIIEKSGLAFKRRFLFTFDLNFETNLRLTDAT